MRSGRAVSVVGTVALCALAIRCAAFGTSPQGQATMDGGGNTEGDGSSASDAPKGAPPGAVVWSAVDGGNGHAYLVVHAPGIQWDEADDAARNAGGYLVTITSSEENTFVFGLLAKDLDASFFEDSNVSVWFGPWLGAERDAAAGDPQLGWTWETGEPFRYTAWAPTEPNAGLQNAETRIGYIGSGPDIPNAGRWADLVPNRPEVTGYVVEFQ
jgi:hypothetical protein